VNFELDALIGWNLPGFIFDLDLGHCDPTVSSDQKRRQETRRPGVGTNPCDVWKTLEVFPRHGR
jgi:hypothetical protein